MSLRKRLDMFQELQFGGKTKVTFLFSSKSLVLHGKREIGARKKDAVKTFMDRKVNLERLSC